MRRLDCEDVLSYRKEYVTPAVDVWELRSYCILDSLSLEGSFDDYEDEGELL